MIAPLYPVLTLNQYRSLMSLYLQFEGLTTKYPTLHQLRALNQSLTRFAALVVLSVQVRQLPPHPHLTLLLAGFILLESLP